MRNNNTEDFKKLERNYRNFRRRLPNKLAITAVNFFKRNFKVGGFVDEPFKKWKKSAFNNRSTMVQSGNTRQAIKKIKANQRQVVVGIAKQNHYAAIHNTGGKIKITPKMRRFFWAKFKETGRERWMFLAITKKTHLEIPKRQFIGDSKSLEKTIDRMIIKELENALK